ncbi:MAG: Rrf2 family transcriptional regulator [Chloroflexi bacterium]|nr:Rrf2 family transcriptional regulator [Chloroflexota bacterium]
MKLSARTEYGVRMMVDLAVAHGRGPVSLSQIAEQQGISQDFLEQLIGPLRKKGLVESVRGSRGGYRLARAPEHISVGDIIWSLEGPFIPMVCLEVDHENQPECCGFLPVCTTRDVWIRLRDQVTATLNTVTLADLVQPKADHPAYTIVQRPATTSNGAAPAALATSPRGIPGRGKPRRRSAPEHHDTAEGELRDKR